MLIVIVKMGKIYQFILDDLFSDSIFLLIAKNDIGVITTTTT